MLPDEDRSQLRYILTGVLISCRHEPTIQQTIQRETANPLYLHMVAEELRCSAVSTAWPISSLVFLSMCRHVPRGAGSPWKRTTAANW